MRTLVFGLVSLGLVSLGLVSLGGCKRAQEASDLLEAIACSDGDKAACRRSFDANGARCTKGEANACILHGIEHENERVVPKDDKKATELFERACSLGNADGCWYAATRYLYGRGVAKDEGRAAELSEKSCAGGSVNGCYELGTVYEHGRGRPKDARLASEKYTRACTLSKTANGLGCSNAKTLAEKSDGR